VLLYRLYVDLHADTGTAVRTPTPVLYVTCGRARLPAGPAVQCHQILLSENFLVLTGSQVLLAVPRRPLVCSLREK
jgi:hypothetical protein